MIKNTITGLVLVGAMCAQAQDLSTEITVDRTVVPLEQKATALSSVVPVFVQAGAPAGSKLRAAEYTLRSDYTAQTGAIPAGFFTGLAQPVKYRGYVRAAYFPAYNLGVETGYRIMNDSTNSLGVAAGYEGSSYNSHGVATDRTVSEHNFGVQADYAHRFANGTEFGVKANYLHSGLKSPLLQGGSQKQNIDAVAAEAEVGREGRKFSYRASVAVDHFGLGEMIGTHEGARETRFKAGGTVGGLFNESAGYELGVGADFMHSEETSAIFTVRPAWTFNYSHVKARVGVRLNFMHHSDKTFRIAPDVMLCWVPGGRFSVFAEFGGGEEFNTLGDLNNYSVFAPGYQEFANSFSPIKSKFGFGFGPFGGFSAEVYGRYESSRNAPMIVLMGSETLFEQVNLSGWGAGVALGYSYKRLLDVKAHAEIYPHSYSSGFAGVYDRAQSSIGASVRVRATERISAVADYEFRGGRRYYSAGEAVDMGSVSELNLGGEFIVTDQLSVGLRLENLLCKRYTILPGITAQGLHGAVSATWRF